VFIAAITDPGGRRYGFEVDLPCSSCTAGTTGASWRPRTRRGPFEHRELHVVEGVGHFLHLEAPGTIAQRILAWLM
jgi:pimeloyl-ACP methyl ester carboxylesterase